MAKWRRRIDRGILTALVAGLIAAGWVVHQTTSASAVRQQVIAQLRQRFVGAEVALGSAQLRLLGGIVFSNLTLYRRDDPSQTPFLHVPAGVIYHDKEQLGRGRLVIRKIKFERPRLTVARDAAGRWNLAGVLGPVRPEDPVPIFEIAQGSAVIDFGEAQRSGWTPRLLEVRDITGSLLNHPLAVLEFDLRGAATSFGPIAARGSWRRSDQVLAASLDLAPISLGPVVLRELARMAPELFEPVQALGGEARLHVDVAYRGGDAPSSRHAVHLELRNGRLVHRSLPFPLDHLNAGVRCVDGDVTIESLTASAGGTRLAASAQLDALPAVGPAPSSEPTGLPNALPSELVRASWLDRVRTIAFSIHGLNVTPQLFDFLPSALTIYRQRFAPTGPLDVRGKIERSSTAWSADIDLVPRGMRFRFESFPYPLTDVGGQLQWHWSSVQTQRLEVDLTAKGSLDRPVTIRGQVHGSGPTAEYSYVLLGDGMPIDEALIQALPAKFQNITRSFHPTGRCDISATIRRPSGAAHPTQHYHVRVRDATMCYDVFPTPLTRLSGLLDIHLAPPGDADGTRFEFSDVRGERDGGRVTLHGSARPTPAGTRLDLAVHGEQFPLDAALADAFSRLRLRPIWDMLAPAGRMDFDAQFAHVEHPDRSPEFTLRVAPRGAAVRPTFFPFALHDLVAAIVVTRTRVEFENLQARHGMSTIRVAGGSIAFRDGGYWADVAGISADPLPVDADLIQACPRAIQAVCRALELRGNLSVRLDRLIIDQPPSLPGPGGPPLFYWKGRVAMADASLRTGVDWEGVTGEAACAGRYRGHGIELLEGHIALERAAIFGQPISAVHARASIDSAAPHELKLRDIRAQLFGGQVAGEAGIGFAAGLQYRLDFKAVGASLAEFARHNGLNHDQLAGTARAELYLNGASARAEEMEGRAAIHVTDGRLYNLPALLDMLKVLGLRSPDGVAFEEAHADLAIHGRQAEIERLDLIGRAISLGGSGRVNLDGSDLRLDLYAVWGHIVQLLPSGLREIPPWLSKNLLKITARGRLGGAIDYAAEPAPVLVEPMKQWLERVQKWRDAAVRQPQSFTPRLKGN